MAVINREINALILSFNTMSNSSATAEITMNRIKATDIIVGLVDYKIRNS
jgi:hypothetical protein